MAVPALFGYRIVHVYPHDPRAYTQGLLYRDGYLYESTGLNGRSTLRKVELESGRVIQQYDLDADYFGERNSRFSSSTDHTLCSERIQRRIRSMVNR